MISLAHAAAAAPGPADMIQQFLPLIIIFVLFWFMLIRPQMKRAKEQRKLIAELQKGDEVLTASGLAGRIVKIGDQYIGLEIDDGVVVNVQKQTVQTLLPKGTLKSL
jgi:preprotein translocase subunit YajC